MRQNIGNYSPENTFSLPYAFVILETFLFLICISDIKKKFSQLCTIVHICKIYDFSTVKNVEHILNAD